MQRPIILVIDDDDDVRESLVDELCGDYEVQSASCGAEAIAALERARYDAVISDLRMPDQDGITVLEHARKQNPDVIRILLTGYLDERAHRATLEPGAPYKVGKPWHDEIEVLLRRAFEQREQRRQLRGSVTDALAVAGIDDELARVSGLSEVAEVLVRRASSMHGVRSCSVILGVCGRQRVIAGEPIAEGVAAGASWSIDEPIAEEGAARLVAQGDGASARDIVMFLCARARRWDQDDDTAKLARCAATDPVARTRLEGVTRRAVLGELASSVMHEMASLAQAIWGVVDELVEVVNERSGGDPETAELAADAERLSAQIVALFCAMRTFTKSGELRARVCSVRGLVDKALALCSAYVRARATLRVADIPDVEILASEPLFLQVIVNLLRNAADASPVGGAVDLEVTCEADRVTLSVTDDGEGVSEAVSDTMFEPFVTTREQDGGSGLGLAISAQIVASHEGEIRYERCAGRGARFVVVVPVHVAT